MWDPSRYLRFGSERTQPCIDLVHRIATKPRRIVDLGCGPGNSTAVIRERWPAAEIIGVDRSPQMLEQARQTQLNVTWVEADISAWRPSEPVDLIFSNAALQWVPTHRALLPALLSQLRPGGILAIQIPYHLPSPAHRAIEELCSSEQWRQWLTPAPEPFEILEPAAYYQILAPHTSSLDLWQTTYLHILERPRAIVDWMRATGLRPYLGKLPGDRHDAFLAAYERKVEEAFPAQPDGRVIFPFPRLFLLAVHRRDAT
ncbi:MAG: trans-aconitate 2-methyltransferase [bacterium]|nr:trans-aconitate 2-methyltransferase [bacterium]